MAEASHTNRWKNPASNLWSWVTPAALFLGSFTAYSSTLTRWYTYDAVSYALQVRTFIETGDVSYLCHPHHVLYNGMGLFFWRVMKALGSTSTPLAALQYMNALWGAAGVALIYIVVSKGGLRIFKPDQPPYAAGRLLGLGAALALGTGFGYWTCATDGRVNMPGLVLIILNVGLLWGMLDSPSMLQCGAAAIAGVLAVGLHQSHGLLAIAAVGTMLTIPRPLVQRLGYAILYTALFSGGVAAMYLTVCLVARGLRSVAEFRHWSLSYAEDGRWWSFDVRNNLPSDVQALVHSFVSSKGQEAGTTASETLRRFIAVGSATAALMPGLHSCRLLRRAVRINVQPSFYDLRRSKIGILALVMIPYAAFFTVWNPGYFVFWMPMAVAILLWLPMACGGLRSWKIAGAAILFGCAVYMMNANLRSTILPRTEWRHNPVLLLCDALKKNSKKGDLILVTGMSDLAVAETYIPYFTPLDLDSINIAMKDHGAEKAIDIMRDAIRDRIAHGHQVMLLDEFHNQTAWRAIISRYQAPPDTKEEILSGYDTRYLFTVRQTRVFGLTPERTARR